MTYLSTAEVAEIKGCSLRYVQQLVQNGKISAEIKDTAANNRTEYVIPLTALPQELQVKWENQKRQALGLNPVKKPVKADLKTAENPRLTLDDLTEKQRNELCLWTEIVQDWLAVRDSYTQYRKGDIDEMYVQSVRLKYPELEISTDILYRRLKAYRNSDISGLIDKRGGKNKGTTIVPEFMLNAFSRFYLDQQCLPITSCYKFTRDWVQEHYPESLSDMPSERTFRRRAEDIPYAVRMYFRKGDKAFSDKCLPYVERLYDELHANDVWIADNHTFDFFTAGKDGKVRRLYLTAFTDAKSGAMVGWNLTYSPSGDSTLLALRHGILRCGVPKAVYFDNGSEFLVSDIGGRGHRRKKDWNKDPLPPNILQLLGIEMHNAIVRNAKAKPIERTFCTFKNQFSRCISTFCGGTILERPESLKYKLKHGIIPEEEQIRKALDSYIDGCYNVAPYGGKEQRYKGMKRFEVWNSSIQETVFRQADEANLSMLLKRVSKPQTVSRNGVYINFAGEKLWYRDADTILHIGEKVYLRYDPADIRQVRIYDMKTDKYLWTWQLDDTMLADYLTNNRDDIATAEKQIAESKKLVREYGKGMLESVDADKRIDIFAAMVRNSVEGSKEMVFKKLAAFVPVFSEEQMEKSPELGSIQEISFNLDILDRLNEAAASRRKE